MSDETPPARANWKAIATVIAVIVVAAGAFIVARGMKSGSSGNASVAATDSDASGSNLGSGSGSNGRRPGTFGTITAITGSTLTVAASSRPSSSFGSSSTTTNVTVHTTSATTVTLSVSGSVSDVKTGDRILVNGSGSTTKLAATTISDMGTASTNDTIGGGQGRPNGGGGFPGGGYGGYGAGRTPPSGAGGRFAFGTVAKIAGTTITITDQNGTTATITTTAATKVTTTKRGSRSDLKTGDRVTVTGTTASDNSVTATAIREGTGGFGAFGGTPGA